MLNIIPKKEIEVVKNGIFKPSQFKKRRLKSRLEKKLHQSLKSFSSIPMKTFEDDLVSLKSPFLNITPYDKEAVEYGLDVLNSTEILGCLSNLNFNQICPTGYLALIAIEYFKNDKNEKTAYIESCRKMIWFQSIESKYEEIATAKGMKESVFSSILESREKIKLIKEYIKIIKE